MTINEMMWGMLIHLGRNLWGEKIDKGHGWADHVRCDEGVWRDVVNHFAECGGNTLVIDCAEGLEYPSHPELAVKGTWSVRKMKAELSRIRDLGIEPVPKLNFSAAHDAWLGEYGHMISTETYYKVVSDVIRDTAEIFGNPRLFHLGWDEENARIQRFYNTITIRQGALYWHDLIFTCDEAKKYGSRPWIWSDKEWYGREEFARECPKDIIQSHFYYSPFFGDEGTLVRDENKMRKAAEEDNLGNTTLCVFKELDDDGFDQVPCGSNIYHDNNFPDLVDHCLATISSERLKGFLIATWDEVKKGKYDKERGRYLAACDHIAGAIAKFKSFKRNAGV